MSYAMIDLFGDLAIPSKVTEIGTIITPAIRVPINNEHAKACINTRTQV